VHLGGGRRDDSGGRYDAPEMTTAAHRDLFVLVAKVWILSVILPAAWT
jgi:hypothetical protein